MNPAFFDLKELVSLGIAYTQVAEIPKDILKLSKLQQLSCHGAPLDEKMAALAERGVKYVKRHFEHEEAKAEEA